jgi:GNAT superfamily N-acetyltransferase
MRRIGSSPASKSSGRGIPSREIPGPARSSASTSDPAAIMRVMGTYTVRALGPDTWDAFAALAERHNGVWGGCWCTWFHRERAETASGAAGTRALKQRLVQAARAHAALVYDGDVAVGSCEYGAPEELPNIYHGKQVETDDYEPPDYRLTCLFVDRDYRRKGVAAAAVHGALELIAQAGGGVVEAYPQDTQGKKVSASFLYNGTRSLFEKAGFGYRQAKGKNHTVMRTTIHAS